MFWTAREDALVWNADSIDCVLGDGPVLSRTDSDAGVVAAEAEDAGLHGLVDVVLLAGEGRVCLEGEGETLCEVVVLAARTEVDRGWQVVVGAGEVDHRRRGFGRRRWDSTKGELDCTPGEGRLETD